MRNLAIVFRVLLVACILSVAVAAQSAPLTLLKSTNWDPSVKACLNELLTDVGRNSPAYNPTQRPYAVFDFDNTVSILDVEEQLAIWQLEKMRFNIRPEQMFSVLTAGVPDPSKDLGKEWNNLTVQMVATDAADAYGRLWKAGMVDTGGKKLDLKKVHASPDWQEFATKARWLYDAIGDAYDVPVSYPWVTYWFTGMTPQEVRAMAMEAYTYYAKASQKKDFWKKVTWKSPENYHGASAGQLSIEFNQGITVSPELKELISALHQDGIDVWICSASFIDVISAAVDPATFGIRGVDGILAMTNKLENGRYIADYDYNFHDQTQGVGKRNTIQKILFPLYNGRGPVFVACDSQGDFNFVTEFADTKAALVLNRARKDDAGILAAIALYQNDAKLSVAAANKAGDIRFLLQGRNENGGTLWAKPQVMRLGKDKEELLSKKAEGWYEKLKAGSTPADLINGCTELTGKLKKYDGYRNVK